MERGNSRGETDSLYEKLSPHVLEQAYLHNRLHDVQNELNQLQLSELELETVRKAEYYMALDALISTHDLTEDEYIARYRDILVGYGEKLDEDFLDSMLDIRKVLMPGQVLLADDQTVVTVAEAVDEPSVRPVLELLPSGSKYVFAWAVLTKEDLRWMDVTPATVIGHGDVATVLMDVHDAVRVDEHSPAELMEIAGQFRAAGEHGMANTFHGYAIHQALDVLDQSSDHQGDQLIEALDILITQPGRVEEFLHSLGQQIARGERLGHNFEAVRAVVLHSRSKKGESSNEGAPPIEIEEVVNLYLELANRGRESLDRD